MTTLPAFKRIVTGHDANGAAIISSAAPPERVVDLSAAGPRFYEIWNTRQTPAAIDRASTEPHEAKLMLAPPPHGTRIRVLDIQPETKETMSMSAEESRKHFELIGAGEAVSTHQEGKNRHPYMHRTETIDYGIVLSGEIYLIMDTEEILCRQGDIVIQRGTNHAWANRSHEICRIAFILIDGKFDPSLA